jgi:hypothetical protein
MRDQEPELRDREPELTLESKAAIRTYLLKLVTLPALILSILSFMLGFSIREGATSRALTQALDKIWPEIEKATQAAAAATTSAEQTKIEAARTKEDLQQTKALQDALQKKDTIIAELAPIIKGDLQKTLESGDATKFPGEANAETPLCPAGSYMVGIRYQIDKGGPHGITSHLFPIYRRFITGSDAKKP